MHAFKTIMLFTYPSCTLCCKILPWNWMLLLKAWCAWRVRKSRQQRAVRRDAKNRLINGWLQLRPGYIRLLALSSAQPNFWCMRSLLCCHSDWDVWRCITGADQPCGGVCWLQQRHFPVLTAVLWVCYHQCWVLIHTRRYLPGRCVLCW